MALAFAKVADAENVEGKLRSVVYDVTLDTSYSANGMAITPANIGLKNILGARVIGGNAAAGALQYWWDTTNNKLLALYPTGSTIAAPAALGDPIVAAGGVAVTGVAADGRFTAGRAKEVAAATALQTLIVRVQFFGN